MLDQARFNELKNLDDEDGTFLKELLESYISDCERNFKLLKQGLLDEDHKAFREACHALKNVGGSVAASLLTSFSGKYMLATDGEITQNGKHMLKELEKLSHETLKALNKEIL